MKKVVCTALVLFLAHFCNAQSLHEAPSLQVGLSGLSFTKGTLDAELIAEIIAEKQKEVKTKLVKNMLLKSIGVENGLFYTYIDNTINIITTEKDEKVRAKNLLENTVNLSFVIAYTDYYLRTMQPNSDELIDIRNLAYAFDIDTSLVQPGMSLEGFTAIGYAKQTSREVNNIKEIDGDEDAASRNAFVGVLLDIFAEVIRKNESLKELGLMRTNYLQNAGATNAYLNLENQDIRKQYGDYLVKKKAYENGKKTAKETEKWNAYLNQPETQCMLQQIHLEEMLTGTGKFRQPLDELENIMNFLRNNNAEGNAPQASDALKAYLKELNETYGSFETALKQTQGDEKEYFFYNINYKQASAKSGLREELITKETGIDAAALLGKKPADKTKNALLEGVVMKYVNVSYKYKLFRQIVDKRASADKIFADGTAMLNMYIRYFGLIKTLSSKGKNTEAIFNAMEHTFPNCGNPNTLYKTISLTYDSAMLNLRNITATGKNELDELTRINGFLGKIKFVALNRYEYMAEYENDIKPALDRLGAYSTKFLVMRDSLFSYLTCIDSSAKADMRKMGLNLNTGFMSVFTRLDEFDKVTTYDLYLNLLSDAGDIFSDENMRNSINRILTFVRSYVKIEHDSKNQISMRLDVEGFIYALQKMNYNKFRPVEFLFTVGTNNAAFHWNALYLTPNDSIKNYSYVSEKIGIKYKIWDLAYTHSFSKGETFTYYNRTYVRTAPASEPVVSNIHMLAYASGILYNIANTGTTKDFNRPMLGVGLGVTFFNGLDMNFCVGRPLQKDRGFFTGGNPTFLNVGFDIQFVEYIDRLNKKRQDNQTQKRISEAVISQNKN